jgi:ATP-dependent helicase HrpB
MPSTTQLPIQEIIPALLQALADHPIVILEAPPGAGKSTELPLHLLKAPWLQGQKMLMLQPRRLAARAVATRLAAQLGEQVGETAGYRVRFERKIGAQTRIEVLTEGLLTRHIQQDNALEGIGLLIFDEFHERSLHADLALVLARQVQEVLRDDLRILIMSATLDTAALSQLLGNAPVITSKGRQHPIDIRYSPLPEGQRLEGHLAATVRKALREDQGDILAFLPGAAEIGRVAEALYENLPAGIRLHMLYGDLPLPQQQEAILPDTEGRRKVVLATTIAETSLTIEGVHVVIDAGLARVPRFDPRSGLTRLETLSVTRDAADQRAGRAGRLGPGVAYRLWAEGSHQYLQAQREPEILQADLAPMALELAYWGVIEMRELGWPTPPPVGHLNQALELLTQLEALENGRITARGKDLLRLPTHPRLAHMLAEGEALGLAGLACDIAALLEERDPLPREAGADLCLRLDALRLHRMGGRAQGESAGLRKLEQLSQAWRKSLRCAAHDRPVEAQDAGRLLAAAYPERVAKRVGHHPPTYRLNNGRRGSLQGHDALADHEWLAIGLMDAGLQEGKIFLAAPLDPQDLKGQMKTHAVLHWDRVQGQILAQTELRLGTLLVSSKPAPKLSDAACVPILCAAIREQPDLLVWGEATAAWQARVMSLRVWRPQEDWPDVSIETLLADLEEWLGPYIGQVRKRDDFKRVDVLSLLSARLPWAMQQQLDAWAPQKIEVPTGSQIRLEYFTDGRPPILAVRLQEMFGQMDTPTVNQGRNPVLIHLLSPAYRPCAVTQDLRSFWVNAYSDTRKDLRGRYPKHSWPEDPLTAEAVRGVKRKS